MAPKHALLSWLPLLIVPLAASGCVFVGGNENHDTTSSSGGDTTDQDVAQYNSVQAKLEQQRSVFKKSGASELAGVGTRLFWLDFTTFAPTLQSYDTSTSQEVDYAFSIGSGDDYNYRASYQMVVNAENTGDSVVFHAFALDKSSASLGDLTVPAPGDGTKWWAYAPDGKDLYYVTTDMGTTLWKWTAGAAMATQLFNLEDAGAQVGEFQDFGVDGNTMVFIESGRIWSLDIAAKKATWLGNKTEADSAFPEKDGVLFSTAKGPFFYSYTSGQLRDISAAIASASFELNATFASAHLYDQDLARNHDLVGYIGQSGLFTFDLASGAVTPVLLDARDDSVVYRHPVILEDNSLFVQGLVSDDGAIGADGPVYRVQLGK